MIRFYLSGAVSGVANTNPALSLGGDFHQSNAELSGQLFSASTVAGLEIVRSFANPAGAGALEYEAAAGAQLMQYKLTFNNPGYSSVDFGIRIYLHNTYELIDSRVGGAWFTGQPDCADILQRLANNINAYAAGAAYVEQLSASAAVGDASSAYIIISGHYFGDETRNFNPNPSFYSGVTGLTISGETLQSASAAHAERVRWAGAGESPGDFVDVSASGDYMIAGAADGLLHCTVDAAQLPASNSVDYITVAHANGELFPVLSSMQIAAGLTSYRALFIANDTGTARTVSVYIKAASFPFGSVSIGADAVAGDSVQMIADELTAPSGVTFSAPTSAATGVQITLADGARHALWLKMVINSGVSEDTQCTVDIGIQY